MAKSTPRRSPEQARAAREEKLNAAHQQITDYVENLTTGEDWADWLAVASQFRTYSFNNIVLIAQQRPDATRVMGYRQWQGLGRQVRKGEKGMTILAPKMGITGWREKDGTVVTGTKPIKKDQVPEGAKPIRSMVGTLPVKVFDIAQTEGEPLPELPIPEPVSLDGPAPEGLYEGLVGIVEKNGFTLTHEPTRIGEDGYTAFHEKRINITPGQSPAQEALTLAHEVGHMLMHDPNNRAPDDPAHHRGIGEVEAESVAYLIASHFGYDTSDNSFPYVAGWAGKDNPTEVVRATATKVVTTAHQIIDDIQPAVDTSEHDSEQLMARARATREAAAAINQAADAGPTARSSEPTAATPAVQLARQAVPNQAPTSTPASTSTSTQPHHGSARPHERAKPDELQR
ncbi:ArdC-like ssDNA-binding domain-containing protein (plasmid) [Saccharopolyspora sp. ID03-671]|uniref:ArdC-like ssDNA-binding domain-containing protein n=1 Tax=Saccharopolyspora sp. ID03-671 TaxID=3073066 RepID=UPI0030F41550